jgi:predicted kinase
MGRGGNSDLRIVGTVEEENNQKIKKQGQLIILCGVPGAGKSTWVKKEQMSGKAIAVVSSDAIRLELFYSLIEANQGSGSAAREKHALVFKIFYKRIIEALQSGQTVVADATNLRAKDRKKLKQLADQENSSTKLVVFENTERAKINNINRDFDQQVPEPVMEKMINRFQSSINNLENEDYSEIEIVK